MKYVYVYEDGEWLQHFGPFPEDRASELADILRSFAGRLNIRENITIALEDPA
jgi:hypothetical protein